MKLLKKHIDLDLLHIDANAGVVYLGDDNGNLVELTFNKPSICFENKMIVSYSRNFIFGVGEGAINIGATPLVKSKIIRKLSECIVDFPRIGFIRKIGIFRGKWVIFRNKKEQL